MKTSTILISLFLLLFTSCLTKEEKQEEKKLRDQTLPVYTIVEIEGCEYLRFYSTHGYIHITHKGNCKNPIHCRASHN